jgi:hypothetical protein
VSVLPVRTWLQSISAQKSLRNIALPNLSHLFGAQVRARIAIALFSESFSDKEKNMNLHTKSFPTAKLPSLS